MVEEAQDLRAGWADIALELHFRDPAFDHGEPQHSTLVHRRRHGGERVAVASIQVEQGRPCGFDPGHGDSGADQAGGDRRSLRPSKCGRAVDPHASHGDVAPLDRRRRRERHPGAGSDGRGQRGKHARDRRALRHDVARQWGRDIRASRRHVAWGDDALRGRR
jgi:hypothetical protein